MGVLRTTETDFPAKVLNSKKGSFKPHKIKTGPWVCQKSFGNIK